MPVTVPIVQPERFEISRTDFPEYLSMGEEGYASVSFVNKGKGIIYNVSAEITGDGITTTEGNQFIGNIACLLYTSSIARNFTAKRLAVFCEKWHSTHTFCNNYEIIAEDKTFIIQRL